MTCFSITLVDAFVGCLKRSRLFVIVFVFLYSDQYLYDFVQHTSDTRNMYMYHYRNTKDVCIPREVLNMFIKLFALRILVFRDVSQVICCEFFKSVIQRSNNPVEASNFAVATFLM
jgi:hypothetical protein